MKISCQSCAAKYTIADEKVSGRIVKIKCKKCASTIVVNGNELVTGGMAAAPASAPMPSLHEIPPGLGALGSSPGAGAGAGDDADTRVMAEAAAGGEPGADEWTVSITDDDQRTMTSEQVVEGYANGTLNQDTYLWRDGMGDWLPLFDVPELQSALAAVGGEAPPSSAGGAPISGGQSPFDVPSAGADLFGAGPASASQPPASGDARHVGERNENSVLFSLSALTAAEDAAAKEAPAGKPAGGGRANIDLAAPPRPSNGHSENKKAGLDDIMNIGGGAIGASPMLAPPDLLAPVKEPEPPPPPPAPISVAPGAMPASQAMPVSSPMMMPEQKKPKGLYIGIGAGVALLLIVGIVVATSGGDETEPVAQNTSTESTDKTGTGTGSATDTGAKAEATGTDTATTAEGDDEEGDEGDEGDDEELEEPGEDATDEQKKAFAEAKKKAAAAGTDKPKDDEPKKKKKKKKKKDDTSDKPKGEFSRAAAMSALSGAAGAAQGCKKKGGPTGSGKARVTFAPSGRVTSATVGGPFAGSAVGSCVAGIFRGASVPPFKGGAVTVSKSFRIK